MLSAVTGKPTRKQTRTKHQRTSRIGDMSAGYVVMCLRRTTRSGMVSRTSFCAGCFLYLTKSKEKKNELLKNNLRRCRNRFWDVHWYATGHGCFLWPVVGMGLAV